MHQGDPANRHETRRGRALGFGTLAALGAMLVLGVASAQAQEDGVGSASARGTATFVAGGTSAQFSAIANCDEAQNTRPFIVRWFDSGTPHTFTRTATNISTCKGAVGLSVNSGIAAGTIDGSVPASVSWTFADRAEDIQDSVSIEVIPLGPGAGSGVIAQADPPAPLNGTPGGVWVFGELPWPSF